MSWMRDRTCFSLHGRGRSIIRIFLSLLHGRWKLAIPGTGRRQLQKRSIVPLFRLGACWSPSWKTFAVVV
jgi:hypothetical protein